MRNRNGLSVILKKAAEGKLASDTIKKIASGEMKGQEAVYSIRANNVGHTGTRTYLDETVSKQQGISDFHQGYLPKGRNLVVTGVRLAATSHATITDPKEMADYSTVVSSWDPALYGGKFVLEQDGKPVISLPCFVLGNGAASQVNVGQEDGFALENPVTLEEGKRLTAYIEYADGETIDIAAQAFIEISFFGIETRPR